MLDEIANAELSQQNYNLLYNRRETVIPKEELNNFKNAIYLYPTCAQVKTHNETFLKNTGHPVARIVSINTPNIAMRCSDEKATGLQSILYLSKNCRIMLRTNLWVAGGLTNGSLGYIREIIYADNESPPQLPQVLMVEFDNYKGPFLYKNYFPIIPVERTWKHNNILCSRKQFPVMLSYALTIHKSQGQTLDKIFLHIRDTERQLGITYVGLSRVKSINDIILIKGYNKYRFDSIRLSTSFKVKQNFIKSLNNINTAV